MAIKLVPGGHPSHALAEAAANAARAGNISPDDVETITLSRPGVTALSGPVHPTDLIGMAHSPAYFLAAGVADQDFSWVHATEAKITDPVIHQLLDKVRVGAPPTEHVERYKQGATVTIRTKDGRTFSNTVYAPKGAGILGIDWADVDAKYRTLVPQAQLSDRQVEASLQVIHDFRHVTHVSALIDLLQSACMIRPYTLASRDWSPLRVKRWNWFSGGMVSGRTDGVSSVSLHGNPLNIVVLGIAKLRACHLLGMRRKRSETQQSEGKLGMKSPGASIWILL